MIPLTVTREELHEARRWVVDSIAEATAGVKKKPKVTIGTMIETPRAALRADEIAEEADFFSFGTNDLTQMTFGFSRDDVESRMMPAYLELGLLKRNPFETIDQPGVGELVRDGAASGRAREARPEARRLRRARRRPGVDRLLLRRRPRLRVLLAVPSPDRPSGRGAGRRRQGRRHPLKRVALACVTPPAGLDDQQAELRLDRRRRLDVGAAVRHHHRPAAGRPAGLPPARPRHRHEGGRPRVGRLDRGRPRVRPARSGGSTAARPRASTTRAT